MKAPIIVIGGPTASGKTAAAIAMARATGGEIISADSVQVYRHLDIGSAKPTAAERAMAPHHLIDVVDPDEHFSGGIYQTLARSKVAEIEARGNLPIVCGGTGLYIRSLIRGLFPGPPADEVLRAQLNAREDEAPGYLKMRLLSIDPVAGERLHVNDRVRLIRALEVYELTGRTITQHHREHQLAPPFREHLTYTIMPPKEILEERIRRRAAQMLAQGFEEEVRTLLNRGYGPRLRAMQSVGYRQVVEHIEGSGEDLFEAIVKAHLKYVKQQRTWFAREGTLIGSPNALPIDEICERLS
mgnify:CR=1 FL=1